MFPKYLTEDIKSHNKEKGYSDTMLSILEEEVEMTPYMRKRLEIIASGNLRKELEKQVKEIPPRQYNANKIQKAMKNMKDLEDDAREALKNGYVEPGERSPRELMMNIQDMLDSYRDEYYEALGDKRKDIIQGQAKKGQKKVKNPRELGGLKKVHEAIEFYLNEELTPKQERALKKILSGKLRMELEKIVDKLEGRKIKASGEKQAIEKISKAVEDMKDLEDEAKKMAKSGDEVSDTEIDSLLKQYENIWKKNKGALKSTLRTAAKAGVSIAGLLGIMSGVGGFAVKNAIMSDLKGLTKDAAENVAFTKYIEKFWSIVGNLLTTGDPGKLSASEFLSASGVLDAAKSKYGL